MKTGNISRSAWDSSVVQQKQMQSLIACSMACNLEGISCNSVTFDDNTKMCTQAKVEVLEDTSVHDSVSIYIDKDTAEYIDQHCKGGYSCCSKACHNYNSEG